MSRELRRDLLRLFLLGSGASMLGLAVNAISPSPVPLRLAAGTDGGSAEPRRITVDRLRRESDAGHLYLLLDVRSEEAFRLGHARAALSAPATRFPQAYHEENLGSLIAAADGTVVICESGECPSADRVARLLGGLGHGNVFVLEGGWRAYQTSGME